MAKRSRSTLSLFTGPVSIDLDSQTASIDLPGGGQITVGPGGAEITTPGGGVTLGPGGGSLDTPAGRVEVRSDGTVLLPGGQVWNSRSGLPGLPLPGSGGPLPIPAPSVVAAPITIPIPVPQFVVERIEIPVAIPRLAPHEVDLPFPIPRLQTAPVEPAWLPGPFEVPNLLPSPEAPARYVNEIKAALAQAVGLWVASAEVSHGTIDGTLGRVPPGALGSPLDVRAVARDAMAASGVPLHPYGELSDVLTNAWLAFFDGYSTIVQYPAFGMWPGPATPQMPGTGQPLVMGGSMNAAGVGAAALLAAGASVLAASSGGGDVEQAWRQLTAWFATRFVAFTASTLLINVLGTGHVPSYAPPATPAGPVAGGTIVRSVGVLAGANPFLVP